ncbi:MAG: BatD family protein, partial [Magnetococcales bacterium]|nr:BatD family protein [Magnetococcales bacterium]
MVTFSPTRTLLFILSLLWMVSGLAVSDAQAAPSELKATVDRTSIAKGESLSLTLSFTGSSSVPTVDLSPLHADFKVLGSSNRSHVSMFNGTVEKRVELVISLVPTQSGTVTIPALSSGSLTTQPITIQVSDAPVGSASPGQQPPMMVSMELEPQLVHVQQQAVLTIRYLWAVNVARIERSEPELSGVLMESLGDGVESTEQHNGRSYHVLTHRYALF